MVFHKTWMDWKLRIQRRLFRRFTRLVVWRYYFECSVFEFDSDRFWMMCGTALYLKLDSTIWELQIRFCCRYTSILVCTHLAGWSLSWSFLRCKQNVRANGCLNLVVIIALGLSRFLCIHQHAYVLLMIADSELFGLWSGGVFAILL